MSNKILHKIEIVMGLTGTGKSMYLSYQAQKAIRKGQTVLSNYYIQGTKKVTFDILRNYTLENCLILLDEGSLDMNSREYKDFSKNLLKLFALSRHCNCSIIVATQHADSIDISVRRLAHKYILMEKTKLGLWFVKYKILDKKIYLTSDEIRDNRGRKVMNYGDVKEGFFYSSKRNYLNKKKWGKYYDTHFKTYDLPVIDMDKLDLWEDIEDIENVDLGQVMQNRVIDKKYDIDID